MYVRWMLVALVGVLSTTLVLRGEAASLDVAFPLYKLQDVLGRAVTTPQGKEVGHIENVILDAATGDLLYCVVTLGGVLGVGGTLRTLPWEMVQGAADRKSFQVHMEEEQFQQAPHFDKDSWPDMEDRHWIDAIHVYYGNPPPARETPGARQCAGRAGATAGPAGRLGRPKHGDESAGPAVGRYQRRRH